MVDILDYLTDVSNVWWISSNKATPSRFHTFSYIYADDFILRFTEGTMKIEYFGYTLS